MSIEVFRASGNTVLVAASSSTGLAATQISTSSVGGVYLANPSTVAIYVAIGSSSVAAAQPTTGIPATGMCLPNGASRTVFAPPNPDRCWISAVTSAGTAAPGLFATPGFGQ